MALGKFGMSKNPLLLKKGKLNPVNAGQCAISVLTQQLEKERYYHCVEHTLNVVESVTRIGKAEGISNEEMLLLRIAAYYHDLGYIGNGENHEKVSCTYTQPTLRLFDLSDNQIEKICDLIMSTHMMQAPRNILECILSDADTDYLGRKDFVVWSRRLMNEWMAYSTISRKEEFYIKQVQFLQKHKYYTRTAIQTRELVKQQNLNYAKTLLP